MRTLISSGSSFEGSAAYSRAVIQGDWIFVSGTTGYDYSTMQISENLVEQTKQCFENIKSVLAKADANLSDIVRVTYMLTNKDDFEKTWPTIRAYLGDIRPASTMIECGLANDAMKIEIEVTCLRK